MRKLMHSKKGFTLVELMIVVVIMAILVAVAVPIYGAVTKNAEKRSCQTNIKTIIGNMGQYQMSGGANGEQIPYATLASTFKGIALDNTAPSDFTKLFNDGIPVCPSDEKSTYTVTVTAEGKTTVECTKNPTDHNLKPKATPATPATPAES